MDLFPSGPRPVLHESGPARPEARGDTFDFSGTFDVAADTPASGGQRYEKLVSDFTKEFYIPGEDGKDVHAEDVPPPVEMPSLGEPKPVKPAGISTRITGGLLGVAFIVTCIMGGFAVGLFVVANSILLTALYAITTGRGSWARLMTRKLIAAAVGVAVLLFMLCAVISPQHRDDTGNPAGAHHAQTPAPKPSK